MNFLPSVNVTCPVCGGKRYNEDTLAVKYKGKDISQVLQMPVSEAYEFFKTNPAIAPKLKAMLDVGLGYIQLGQSAVTLSGGEPEAQARCGTVPQSQRQDPLYAGRTHDRTARAGCESAARGAGKIVDQGNTVVVIEHNLDVLKCMDYIFDMGPEGGAKGGMIIASGTPEQLASDPASVTGVYLKEMLEQK